MSIENDSISSPVKRSISGGSVLNSTVRVLVADDEVTSRKILSAILGKAGYDVVAVEDGFAAREILLSDQPPDIAILDWVMPGLTGPELCTLIKEQVKSFVFTVLVTAKTDSEDIVHGLESGAHEFLSKPINAAEFNVRMSAAVRILQYERALNKKNQEIAAYAKQMRDLAETRAGQLVHSERLATLGQLSAGIGHEIKNPVAYVAGNMQVLGRYQANINQAVEYSLAQGEGDTKRLKFLVENGQQLISGIEEGLERIVEILDGLSRFAHRGTRKRAETYLAQCINDALDLSKNKWKYHVEATTDIDELHYLSANAQEITQVLINLMVNASDAMQDRDDGKDSIIHVTLKPNGKYQRIVVADNGPGIPASAAQHIWDPFFTTKEQGQGTGLGLAICSGIIEEHGGNIFHKNLPDGGACFVIDIPTGEE